MRNRPRKETTALQCEKHHPRGLGKRPWAGSSLGQGCTGSLKGHCEFTRETIQGRAFHTEGTAGARAWRLGDWVLEPCWAVGVRGRYRLVSRSGAGPASQLGDLRKRSLLSWPREPHSDPELCGQRYSIYSGEAQEDVGRRVP